MKYLRIKAAFAATGLALALAACGDAGSDEDAREQGGPREGDPPATALGGRAMRSDAGQVGRDVVELVFGVLRHRFEVDSLVRHGQQADLG